MGTIPVRTIDPAERYWDLSTRSCCCIHGDHKATVHYLKKKKHPKEKQGTPIGCDSVKRNATRKL